jgi:glycosyltransferase involved in cell wall biosynthesis
MSIYNEPISYIDQSVSSILNQIYHNIELIIFLDNPDNKQAKNKVEEYVKKDARVRFYENEKNIGLAATLNKAIDLSKGEYIARMDADDISFPERIQEQVNFLVNHQLDLIGSSMIIINEDGKNVGQLKIKSKKFDKLIKYSTIAYHPTWFGKAKIFQNIRYRDFPVAQDYDFLLRFIEKEYKIDNIDTPLVYYRLTENNASLKKAYLQIKLFSYMYKLHLRRKKNKPDSYDPGYISNFKKNSLIQISYELAYSIFVGSRKNVQNKLLLFASIFVAMAISPLFIKKMYFIVRAKWLNK